MSRTETISSPAKPQLDLRRMLLIGAVLPTVVAVVTYLLMTFLIVGTRSVLATTIGFGCFVLEVGLVGIIVGHAMPQPQLRWLIYGWMMLLVDLLVGSLAMNSADGYVSETLPAAALIGAQIGLAIIWGILGTARWYWRAPFTLVLGPGLLGFWIWCVSGWNAQLLTGILVVQAVTLTLMCVGLRVRGYRLMLLDANESAGGTQSGRFQFGIRDVLVWTTVLAILLALMRGAGMFVWVNVANRPSVYFKGTVALLSAMVILFSLWASLGRGRWWLRYLLLVMVLLALGTMIGAVSTYGRWLFEQWFWRRAPFAPSVNTYDYDLYRWYEVGWWWIAWMFLSGGLLAASLMIFRAVGYRLVRSGKATVHGAASR